jgi:hypothetical protein
MYLNFSEINPVTRSIVYMCRIWKPSSQVTGRQGDNYHIRYHRHAAVPALPLQHRRYLCQELQVDIRQIMFVSGLLRGSVATPICSPPTDGASACRVSWRLHGESWLEGKYKAQTDYPFLTLKMEATGCPETSVFTTTGYVIAHKNTVMFREIIRENSGTLAFRYAYY